MLPRAPAQDAALLATKVCQRVNCRDACAHSTSRMYHPGSLEVCWADVQSRTALSRFHSGLLCLQPSACHGRWLLLSRHAFRPIGTSPGLELASFKSLFTASVSCVDVSALRKPSMSCLPGGGSCTQWAVVGAGLNGSRGGRPPCLTHSWARV